MKILVIGANGLLGRELVKQLSPLHEVYALIREFSAELAQLPVRMITCDLPALDLSVLPAGIDAVYYLAQSKRFREFPEGAADMAEINVKVPLKVAEWARNTGVGTFVYASTGGVYGSGQGALLESAEICLSPEKGFYANSKVSCELLLGSFAAYFERFAILRPFFIYGPAQDRQMLIPRLVRMVAEREPISLAGDDGIRINPVYVTDAALAGANILSLGSGSYVFNIGGVETASIRQIGTIIGKLLGKQPVFSLTGQKAEDLVGDISLMSRLLHAPCVNLESGLSRMTGAIR